MFFSALFDVTKIRNIYDLGFTIYDFIWDMIIVESRHGTIVHKKSVETLRATFSIF